MGCAPSVISIREPRTLFAEVWRVPPTLPPHARDTKKQFCCFATCKRVIDGDTFEALIPFVHNSRKKVLVRIRVRGIDTPEMRGPHRADAEACKRVAERHLNNRTLFLTNIKPGKFNGRYVAGVFVSSGIGSWSDFAETMLEVGPGTVRMDSRGKRLPAATAAAISSTH
jgi:endonuclease YncB( thermonuclease family)